MKLLVASLAVIASTFAAECPPKPSPAPIGLDASRPPVDASPAANAACANLAKLGCLEGTAGDCAVTIDHVTATRLTHIDVACLALAPSKAVVRTCGGVTCAE